jgi:signal transduction histidine kinase
MARHKDGRAIPVELTITPVESTGRVWFSAFLRDLTEKKAREAEHARLEARMAESQKLESIGQLAAGIAHEINTPAQFVSDNTRFLQDSFGALSRLFECCCNLDCADTAASLENVRAAALEADLDFLLQEIPRALSESLSGLERVTSIVKAMKEFSHPGSSNRSKIDLNQALQSTATVARNEWKYVANLEFELDPALPLVSCYPGELNQAVLNMIVNSAHAIADVIAKAPGTLGTIRIGTRRVGERVQITIADTGGGIPEAIRHRIFDPFFTTKQVGKGTGQGLSIARSVVVDKHGGTIDVQSEVGVGTTFVIELAIDADVAVEREAAAA